MVDSESYQGEVLSLSVQTNMRPSPPTVSPQHSLSRVMDVMTKENVGSVVIVENNHPVGIITEKDVLQRVIRPGKDLDLTLVKDIMSKPLVAIEAEQSVADALDVMHRHNIRRLIITKDGSLIGLTTEKRLLEVAYGHYIMKESGLLRGAFAYEVCRIRVAYVSTYPPRECGIATYTRDLVDAVSTLPARAVKLPAIVAVNDKGGHYDYGSAVKFQIDTDEIESYEKAAEYINRSEIDIVNLQHEYGLFEGVWGEHAITLLERLEKPVVTTLHTVLQDPVPEARRVLEQILQYSDYVVVMARIGIQLLEQLYGSLTDKIRYIPHGCPNVPYMGTTMLKQSLGFRDRAVLSTFGLLSRAKGIEYVIEALPQIVKENPQTLYLIIGETHPEVRKREGETYRESLLNMVDSLGLQKNVRFVNRFLSENELLRYLQATDVYILPYPNREQISSGTLSYALSTGKAIVTTPFLHAEEVINNGAALECEFKNPHSIADSVMMALRDRKIRQGLEKRAYEYSRDMIWPNVGMRYVNLFYQALGL